MPQSRRVPTHIGKVTTTALLGGKPSGSPVTKTLLLTEGKLHWIDVHSGDKYAKLTGEPLKVKWGGPRWTLDPSTIIPYSPS